MAYSLATTRSCSVAICNTCSIRAAGSSLRQLSTRMDTLSSPSDAMLSPFLVRERELVIKEKTGDIDTAFMGLLKAMSVLKSSPTDDDNILDLMPDAKKDSHNANFDEVKNAYEGGEAKPVKKYNFVTSNDKNSRYRAQEAMNSGSVGEVIKIWKDSVMSPGDQLDDTMLERVINFLSHKNLHASFDALKYHVQRSKDQGKLVKLNVYRHIIQGIYRAKNIKGYALRDLGEEIYYHIRDSFAEGNTVIYQHILLPSLVCQLARHRDIRVNQCARPIVEYMLAEEFPVLDPELYEAILNAVTINKVGDLYLPYHKLLTELVSRGTIKL